MDDLETKLKSALTATLAWDKVLPPKRRVDEFYNSGLSDGWTACINYIKKQCFNMEPGEKIE